MQWWRLQLAVTQISHIIKCSNIILSSSRSSQYLLHMPFQLRSKKKSAIERCIGYQHDATTTLEAKVSILYENGKSNSSIKDPAPTSITHLVAHLLPWICKYAHVRRKRKMESFIAEAGRKTKNLCAALTSHMDAYGHKNNWKWAW